MLLLSCFKINPNKTKKKTEASASVYLRLLYGYVAMEKRELNFDSLRPNLFYRIQCYYGIAGLFALLSKVYIYENLYEI